VLLLAKRRAVGFDDVADRRSARDPVRGPHVRRGNARLRLRLDEPYESSATRAGAPNVFKTSAIRCPKTYDAPPRKTSAPASRRYERRAARRPTRGPTAEERRLRTAGPRRVRRSSVSFGREFIDPRNRRRFQVFLLAF
jgi:hypothetical protein